MKLFLSAFLFLLFIFPECRCQDSNFVLVKKEGNIFIYERWITFPKSDPVVDAREVKGEFFFNNTALEGVRLLQNEQQIQKWQSHVSEFKVYKKADTTTWIEYSYHDIPWPVSDQDHLLAYKIVRSDSNAIFVTFESIEDNKIAPLRDDARRMTLSGSWTFERITDTKVKATYRILSMPMNIPRFLTDPVIRNNMMSTIREYVALVEKKKG